jgi:hypothetical protein
MMKSKENERICQVAHLSATWHICASFNIYVSKKTRYNHEWRSKGYCDSREPGLSVVDSTPLTLLPGSVSCDPGISAGSYRDDSGMRWVT